MRAIAGGPAPWVTPTLALAAAQRGEEAIAEFAPAVDPNPDYGPALGKLARACARPARPLRLMVVPRVE